MLAINSVSIGYSDKQVVKNVSFAVSQGEFCALLGLNGSGKTTLLKGICGLLPISDGRCFFDEIDLTKLSEKNRAKYISYIPQRHSKLIGVTVIDAVLMGFNAKLGFLEFPSQQDRDSAHNALDTMGVSHLANEDFSRLSEGQKQLIILARALVQNAPVMLMDEPDSALDFPNKHMILSAVQRLVKGEAGGRGYCFTSVNTEVKQYPRPPASLVTLHDPNLALKFCDRLILLSDGEVATELSLTEASLDDVQAALSTVYKDITVYEHNSEFKCDYAICYRTAQS